MEATQVESVSEFDVEMKDGNNQSDTQSHNVNVISNSLRSQNIYSTNMTEEQLNEYANCIDNFLRSVSISLFEPQILADLKITEFNCLSDERIMYEGHRFEAIFENGQRQSLSLDVNQNIFDNPKRDIGFRTLPPLEKNDDRNISDNHEEEKIRLTK